MTHPRLSRRRLRDSVSLFRSFLSPSPPHLCCRASFVHSPACTKEARRTGGGHAMLRIAVGTRAASPSRPHPCSASPPCPRSASPSALSRPRHCARTLAPPRHRMRVRAQRRPCRASRSSRARLWRSNPVAETGSDTKFPGSGRARN